MANYNKRLNVRCQYCNKINKTRTLEMELLCKTCGKWAKYRDQKVKLREIWDKSNNYIVQVYVVEKIEKNYLSKSKISEAVKI